MKEILINIFQSIWNLLLAMSPYLIFGFFVSGILNLVIPREKIGTHLSGNKFSSIVKASIFGVPLPLCSCGVIPVAAFLRKEGADKGSTISFLASTPTTGIDSILATYSLLGPLFAIIRPVAAFFSGIFAGTLTMIFEKKGKEKIHFDNNIINTNSTTLNKSLNFWDKIKKIINYGFFELINDAGKWILIGVIAGGIITFVIPTDFIHQYLGNPIISYPVMLILSIPMYICATGSIPIAAALILKGMSPGAGLIFLIAGPATNTATISFIAGKLGIKNLFIYLFSIISTSVIFGIIVDQVFYSSGENFNFINTGMSMFPLWLQTTTAILLTGLIFYSLFNNFVKKHFNKSIQPNNNKMNIILKIPNMTCQHCANTIQNAVKTIPGVEKINISLNEKLIQIEGEPDRDEIISIIQKSGYSIEK